MATSNALKVAIEGCGHGTLDAIYASVQKSCEVRGWETVDLVIICGDFQAVRTRYDLNVTAMPAKYRQMGDFHQYYWGTKKAPYLTVFIGGNHEASNHLFELYYGGWAAQNIYYLGAANVLQLGPIKIAALSGIWQGRDYRKPHFERLPYNNDTMRSIYHQRELDVRKLLAYRSQVDIGLSHDWPHEMWKCGDHEFLFKAKPYFLPDARKDNLGSKAATQIVDRLRPPYWFCAHMHFKFAAFKDHETGRLGNNNTKAGFETKESEVSIKAPQQSVQVLQRDTSSRDTPFLFEKGGSHRQSTSTEANNIDAVSAWSNFSNTIQAQDAKECGDEEENRRDEEQLDGRRTVAEYDFQETFKPVSVAQLDGAQSRRSRSPVLSAKGIPQLDGTCCSTPKRRRKSSPSDETQILLQSSTSAQTDGTTAVPIVVTNPDAIDVDMSDSDEQSDAQPLLTKEQTIDSAPNISEQPPTNANSTSLKSVKKSVEKGFQKVHDIDLSRNNVQSEDDNKDDIPQDIRAQLAEMSATFASENIERSADLPPSESITNKQTRFLALSKVEKGHERQFLQLIEIEPTNNMETSQKLKRPLKLSYDPEWLAILRTFASELQLGGSPNDKVPSHRGDTFYRDKIIEEEKWVKDNIVDKNLLMVPENFEITVEQDKPEDKIGNDDMPREQTNPQTAKFCQLIGIDNKFDFSEEDRDVRMAAGAPPGHTFQGGRHRGRGRGRGGWRDGGRGGRGGHGRGGGRNRW